MQKGFTLLELLIVVAIIGVLASIILVSYSGYADKARIAKTLSWAGSINHSLGDQAVGVWTFDNINGATIYDDSGMNNTGVALGSPAVVTGVVGKALQFDGVDDYVSVANTAFLPTGASARSMFGWIKTNGTQLGRANYFGYGDGSVGRSFNLSSGVVGDGKIYFVGYNTDAVGTKLVGDGVWHYIGVTYDGVTVKIYVDGILDVSQNKALNTTIATYTFVIGRQSYPDGADFRRVNGIIDDVRIFSAALTQAQIQQYYANGLPTHQNLAKK